MDNGGCPFCGKQIAFIDTLNYASGKPSKYRVQCQECFAATRWCDTREQAWELWNRRTEPPKRSRGRSGKTTGGIEQ